MQVEGKCALAGQAGCSYVVSSASAGASVGGFVSSSAPMVKGRSERVNPAARTVTPASTTRLAWIFYRGDGLVS